MVEYYKKRGERTTSYMKLIKFLANPGRFSLTILGDRGVGKKFAIQTAFDEIKSRKDDCLDTLVFIDAAELPENEKDIDKLLENNDNGILVVEDVEQLNSTQQKLLFKAMQTEDGTFGIESKRYKVRMCFTSSAPIDQLRTSNEQLRGYFWDRISQLIVYFPNFEEEGTSIVSDFKTIWRKMEFENIEKYKHLSSTPNLVYLESFLENNKVVLEGNFRDLDKLAIMFFNYRIFYYGEIKKINKEIEKEVFESVKNDFLMRAQLKNPSLSDLSYFKITDGISMQDLKKQFKHRVKEWGRNKYKTIAAAERKLGLGQGTMKNY